MSGDKAKNSLLDGIAIGASSEAEREYLILLFQILLSAVLLSAVSNDHFWSRLRCFMKNYERLVSSRRTGFDDMRILKLTRNAKTKSTKAPNFKTTQTSANCSFHVQPGLTNQARSVFSYFE